MEAISQRMPGNGCAETIRKEVCSPRDHAQGTGPVRNPIDDEEMIRLYQEGWGLKKLGDQYGVSDGTIRNHLKKFKIDRRGRGCNSGENHGAWRGGIARKKEGHILRKSPQHPFKDRLGYVRDHRLVVEEACHDYLLPF